MEFDLQISKEFKPGDRNKQSLKNAKTQTKDLWRVGVAGARQYNIMQPWNKVCKGVFLPLGLPVYEAERGVEEPAHLSQRPLLVNTHEEVWGWGRLEGNIHHLSNPTEQTPASCHHEMQHKYDVKLYRTKKRVFN